MPSAGVENVDIDLPSKKVTVTGNVTPEAVKEKVGLQPSTVYCRNAVVPRPFTCPALRGPQNADGCLCLCTEQWQICCAGGQDRAAHRILDVTAFERLDAHSACNQQQQSGQQGSIVMFVFARMQTCRDWDSISCVCIVVLFRLTHFGQYSLAVGAMRMLKFFATPGG